MDYDVLVDELRRLLAALRQERQTSEVLKTSEV